MCRHRLDINTSNVDIKDWDVHTEWGKHQNGRTLPQRGRRWWWNGASRQSFDDDEMALADNFLDTNQQPFKVKKGIFKF